MACSRCSSILLNAFVIRVNRRIRLRIVRFCRSTKHVETWAGSGLPLNVSLRQPTHSAGRYRVSGWSPLCPYSFTSMAYSTSPPSPSSNRDRRGESAEGTMSGRPLAATTAG